MKTRLQPVALNEKSFRVNLLHKALAALGQPASKIETDQNKAGEDTLKQMRTLQARLNAPIDDSALMDDAASTAIEEALEKRGLTDASRSFTVAGKTKQADGSIKKRQPLVAFNLNLGAVAVYRTVKNVAEIQKNGGFEFLGEAVSDNLGNYRITFYDWQFGKADRRKADVVVYAMQKKQVIGCSRLINSEAYSQNNLVRDMDVIITEKDTRTEYKAMMGELKTFLDESKSDLSKIAVSHDQLVFTAGQVDTDRSRVRIAAMADSISKQDENSLSHELLYALGRQNIQLTWDALYKKQDEELRRAIAKSVDEGIIRKFTKKEIDAFINAVMDTSVKHKLEGKSEGAKYTLDAVLSNALPEKEQRVSFMKALNNFKGSDFSEFWSKHLPAQPEFKDKPKLISGLLFTQQLGALTGDHQKLLNELQVNKKFTSMDQLIDLEKSDWVALIKKTGVPDFIQGQDDEEKAARYAGLMEGLINAAFPTRRIAKMLKNREFRVEKGQVLKSINTFLENNRKFDFAVSRVHDFKQEIKAAAGNEYSEARSELMKIQRVFQVSATPETMTVLMDKNLHSAYTIANIPRKSFIKKYGKDLGGDGIAFAIHQRASHISAKAEMAAAHIMEYSHGLTPQCVMSKSEYNEAMKVIQNNLPNPSPTYAELFGSPDICECKECRSVYSASAYFVDLVRFLWRSATNDDGKSPLDMLEARRPDLLYLPLTCENTNTVIPYIDLANEIMEYYTANGSLKDFEGYDTGKTTAEELRANPQNFDIEAYRKLKDAKYPFTLPYHQPLDVIRIYSGHLKVSRYKAMKAMNSVPDPDPAKAAVVNKAMAAESLEISEEEYAIFTGKDFNDTADTTQLHEYFGYSVAGDLKEMSKVPEFLRRSGIKYTDLVEIVKTLLINPYQEEFDFLEKVFSYISVAADTIYSSLKQIEAGTLKSSQDTNIKAALKGYNDDETNKEDIKEADFDAWVKSHFSEYRQVITLYEEESKCALESTELRSIKSIYEKMSSSGISDGTWSKIHRFIRLWKKLGWTIHETDLMLASLGDNDITTDTVSKLESVSLLSEATKLSLNQLAAFWGNIDTYGEKSLYKKLFLNKSVQSIEDAFKADAWGGYLQDTTEILADHQSAILAAFRLKEEDLDAILEVAKVVEGGAERVIDMDTDILSLPNISTLYRYAVLAKGLKMKVKDVCKLISLFKASPFSLWDISNQKFTKISPADTYKFYKLACSTKEQEFKSSVLEYILEGTLPADSTIGLKKEKALKTAKAIREAFSAIEQDHPDTPESPLTSEILAAKLSLTFDSAVVVQFMEIVNGTRFFEIKADKNLPVTIPADLATKYTYTKASGRLTCDGIMSTNDRTTLKGLTSGTGMTSAQVTQYDEDIDELYEAPEKFIKNNFDGVFTDLNQPNPDTFKKLLDRPTATDPDKKLTYVYDLFLPLLKNKLRRDAITQHIAALIGLSEEATALLIDEDIDDLITNLSTEGFSASFFSGVNWAGAAVKEITEDTIDFSWGTAAPYSTVPADQFSARWKAYVAAPASGKYALTVEVEEADDVFKLYLDDELIDEKTSADTETSSECEIDLNATKMHLLVLAYAETSQNAGVRLYWKTATTALEIIPASAAYPAAILDDFADQTTVYHRAAKFISGFELSETELDHFIDHATDFDSISFMSLKAADWQRICDYATLRNAVPQARALLTDVFALANRSNPAPTVDELADMLYLATAWDEKSLDYLIDTHFKLGVDHFKNEIKLNLIYKVMQIVSKTGISAETIAEWGKVETDFDTLHKTALLIRDTVKAKYDEEDWLDLASDLSDDIRANQRQALIGYLLQQKEIKYWKVKDEDGLFEYFLIDVQMGACMDTSRIVQANSSIQMFINRCLLNLESNLDTTSGYQKGVSPDAIDKDRWEWMKNYRVWEANRKIFLYPENWLEPEWRNDRSVFFRELESYLVQNDITDRSVEQAFRNYLTSLNEVANLEMCGIYQENNSDGETLKCLHVFGRTRNAPYKFFYRRWNKYMKWSAWEKVQLDIRNVEDGDSSGVHLIPVVWKKRFYLFWPEFMEKQESQENNSKKTIKDMSGDTTSELETTKYWEVRLAWSEYIDGKWSPKQVSKEFIETTCNDDIYNYQWVLEAYDTSDSLNLYLKNVENDEDGQFTIYGVEDKIEATSPRNALKGFDTPDYANRFMRLAKESELQIGGQYYLNESCSHELLYSNDFQYPTKPCVDYPFFYSDRDGCRTYFVRPVDVDIVFSLKYPERMKPYFHGIQVSFAEDMFNSITRSHGAANRPVTAAASMAGDRSSLIRAAGLKLGSESKITRRSGESRSTVDGIIKTYVQCAFGAVTTLDAVYWGFTPFTNGDGLEFHTFYHPFSHDYVKNLNAGGISRGSKASALYPAGLMESDTEITSDEGKTFEDEYDPNFLQGLIRKPSDFAKRTYYKENVCFDVYGANSIYNWELFFHAPLYIATRLSKNGKFEEAMKWFHYIFDPTTDEMPAAGESETARYWKVLPFKTEPKESLEEWFRKLTPSTDPKTDENQIISEWRDNPFDPHIVASNRPIAYMKHVVMKYVENLIAWGDSLFRQFTMESVNEALQIYVIAAHVLGPYPEFVPKRGEIKSESYNSLKSKWDDFSNALVSLENIFPYSSSVTVGSSSTGTSFLGIGKTLYFCIPPNDELLDYWDTVKDRLYKIRHCQDIDGVERKLALFSAPISPEALIQAVSQGLSLGSILSDLSSPPPHYRFSYLIQKANEFCNDVKALGSAILAALEKKDAEELSLLRASHETAMLELITEIKERQVLEAKANKENLEKTRETAELRLQYYIDLLGNETVTVPAEPTLDATLTSESQLPVDTAISKIETDVDVSLVESDESGVKMISKEKEEIDKSSNAMISQQVATGMEGLAGTMNFIPNFSAELEPFGCGASISYGGSNIAGGISGLAKVPQIAASILTHEATLAAKTASYIRREQDWTLQANLAAREIIQLDKQITSADIRIQVAEKELENHEKQIEHAEEVELFLEDKFTNEELYQWMKEQLFSVYKQSYNLAFDMAKKAEKAYKYEIGTETASFIQYGYWDNAKQGLVAGEKLQLALRQMEKSYLGENKRELELTKSVSLAMLDPLALIQLKETGKCYVSLPEELFDLDFQGHYFRRIKSVSLSIPCVTGPYTTINCTLRLLKSHIRINTSDGDAGYEHNQDGGLWIDDDRFRTSVAPVTAIATSTGQNDAGMFELNFRDERYLPFEGGGVISDWQIELGGANAKANDGNEILRQFDYDTISDVIMHVKYTARESGGVFKEGATDYIKDFIMNTADLSEQPLMRLFSLKHEFPTEWHKFLYPSASGGDQVLIFTLGKERFPFIAQGMDIIVMKLDLFAKCTGTGKYYVLLSYTDFDGNTKKSTDREMTQSKSYGVLHTKTIDETDTELTLDEMDVEEEISLNLTSTSGTYTTLKTDPDEVEDIFFVVHYKLDES